MALIVLDASVVIAHLDPADAHHDQAMAFLLEHADDDLRLPASAYAETLVDPARRKRVDEARNAVEAMRLQIEPITKAIAERAASLRASRRMLRLPDALVLACGDVLDADLVVTADRRWRRLERVRVIS
ncbi:MAG: PIN domain-containing protein [Actinobacteria bacterium]|nr:MAG: PIN domain-containing protein [Actinomycetota bacterium]TMM30161.1 MAG: PIN domain-containing protein [Actinomycetota bacterium]